MPHTGDDVSGADTDDADCDGVPTDLDCDDVNATAGDVDDPECDDIATDAAGGDLFQLAATSFDMGSTDEQPGCFNNEFEVMPVTMTHDYFIGETEVTQSQYDAMTSTKPSFFDVCGDDCPVERVSWNMAAAYTNGLSAASGLDACYTCEGEGNTIACAPAMDPYTCEGYRPGPKEGEGRSVRGGGWQYSASGLRVSYRNTIAQDYRSNDIGFRVARTVL